MPKVKSSVSITVDNCMAGHGMTEERPFGDFPHEELLHGWMFDDPEAHKTEREEIVNAGAFIMGRNMFGPRGAEYDKTWQGWWDDDPPYHAPVYVLTHTPREPIELKGGTTFYFVTDGIESALRQAKAAAGERDVAIAGGANVVNQYLAAGLIDELWLHVVPYVFGDGKRLFEGVSGVDLKVLEVRETPEVTHVRYGVLNGS
jgi:dihydrofolate reductase